MKTLTWQYSERFVIILGYKMLVGERRRDKERNFLFMPSPVFLSSNDYYKSIRSLYNSVKVFNISLHYGSSIFLSLLSLTPCNVLLTDPYLAGGRTVQPLCTPVFFIYIYSGCCNYSVFFANNIGLRRYLRSKQNVLKKCSMESDTLNILGRTNSYFSTLILQTLYVQQYFFS